MYMNKRPLFRIHKNPCTKITTECPSESKRTLAKKRQCSC